MNKNHKARLENAFKMGQRIKEKLDEGYIIYTDENYIVQSVSFKGFIENDGLTIETDRGGHVVYFDADPNSDDGMLTSIKEFNKEFKKWTMIHPKNIEPLM